MICVFGYRVCVNRRLRRDCPKKLIYKMILILSTDVLFRSIHLNPLVRFSFPVLKTFIFLQWACNWLLIGCLFTQLCTKEDAFHFSSWPKHLLFQSIYSKFKLCVSLLVSFFNCVLLKKLVILFDKKLNELPVS